MSYQDLLRSQRNEVFRLIEKKGLTPAEFEWEPTQESDGQATLGFYEIATTPGLN